MEPDERLIDRLRAGDLTAFDRLYERYEAPLFGFIRSYLGDDAEAEDVFHEAFLQVIRRPDRDLSRFRGWLYTTARHLSLNRLRARRRGAEARRILAAVPELAASPEQLLAEENTRAALTGALQRLRSPLSELFHLRASGLSYEEMAEVLELPLGTVKSRMHEMVETLRKELAPWNAP